MSPSPSCGCGYRRATEANGLSAFRASGTAWFRWRRCWSLVPSLRWTCCPQQHGFRPGLDAKMALRRVYWHVTQHGRREVVDADLRDYFNSIPHAPLMRSLSRRIADGRLLHVIKRWLTAPVVEVIDGRSVQTAEARRTKRGTPQGGVISPLLANCYFRRILLPCACLAILWVSGSLTLSAASPSAIISSIFSSEFVSSLKTSTLMPRSCANFTSC